MASLEKNLDSTSPADSLDKNTSLDLSQQREQHADIVRRLSVIQHTDPAHPIQWHWAKKWTILTIYSLLQVFVTFTSTSYASVEELIGEKYGGSVQVLTLGQSLFVAGNAIGPCFLAPLSYVSFRQASF